MNEAIEKPELRMIERKPGEEAAVEGDLTEANADEFERYIDALALDAQIEITLNLHMLDIADGIALAAALNSLRRLRARSARVILKGAPQMLCHNLYRVGLLEDDSIKLIDMRLDEPESA